MSTQQEPVSPPSPVVAEGLSLGVVGAGVMGQTLIRGLITSGLIPREQIWAGDKNGATCDNAAALLGIPVECEYQARVPGASVILVCVKPADAPVVLSALRNAGLRRDTLLISILAGVSTDRLEALLGTENPVVRAMPNTPAVVGAGMTVVCRGRYASKGDLDPRAPASLRPWASACRWTRSTSTPSPPSAAAAPATSSSSWKPWPMPVCAWACPASWP